MEQGLTVLTYEEVDIGDGGCDGGCDSELDVHRESFNSIHLF